MRRSTLLAKERTDTRKSTTKKLRALGEIPATVYGKGIVKSISVKGDDIANLFRSPDGRLSLIDLIIEGGDDRFPVIIQAIQKNPLNQKIIHLDFHRISLTEKVHTSVPIRIVGTAPGTNQGGILEQHIDDLEIKALPDNIPAHIEIDVSNMNIGDRIHVADIQIPEGVELVGPSPDTIVVSVLHPHIQVEEAAEEQAETAETPAEE